MKTYIRLLLSIGAAVLVLSCQEEMPETVNGIPYLSAETGTFNEWPAYEPTIYYNLKDDPEFKDFPAPTRNLPYNNAYSSKRATVYDNGKYWSYFEGPDANTVIKGNEAAINKMFEQLEADAAYMRDEMGWPPTTAVRKGFRDAVFLFGSGLATDNASNTDLGGWQSGITISNVSYPIVLLSYYPTYCFDPDCEYSDKIYQTEAVTHEYIHAIFASMPGCRKASWFHEGANCWLQATMTYEREFGDNYEADSFGWLSTGSVIAPFMPIECYSGWLLDGSFGGPGAQGVNNNFRQTIGGVQYSEVFPTFLGEIIGKGSVPWVWNNCTGYVLEGIAKEIGQEQMERMIQEYRGRLALCDMGRYSKATLNLYRNSMGAVYGSDVDGKYVAPWKATPYASMSPVTDRKESEELDTKVPVQFAAAEEGVGEWDDADWLKPDELTLPGWTGANIIPFKVEGDKVLVAFSPYGENSTAENVSCQLCYRTAEGKTVYGKPFKNGSFLLDLSEDRPANDVVFAVVCSLHYTFENNKVRTRKYDYRLKVSGNAHPANIHKNWFDWQNLENN